MVSWKFFLTFESVDEIFRRDLSYETLLWQFFNIYLFVF